MGITGLLPFLEKSKVSRPANIKEFKGCTVAADAYCWLHKGAFSCADKLARGEQTDMYVQYCMKFVNMLLANEIKPILVFDGRHLPAKAQTEKKRREKREENRKQAANLLRQGHTTEALSFLRRCIDVTHKMALTLMQECRKRNVDCIVAPYEADVQLAFFSINGIADLIITEDSDLMLFGCKKVMFKLDLAGNGILVDQEKLYLSMGPRPETYSFDKFRYMCILSGCDYLDSLPGIGLGKACKFISRTQDPDIYKSLSRLPSQLNIRGLSVPMEYRDNFMKADAMFQHQLVFDPIARKTKPLNPHRNVHPTSPLAGGPLPGCTPEFDEETSYQLALGNLDPFSLEKVDNYDPSAPLNENTGVRTNGWNQTAVAPHPSIWNPQFKEIMTKPKPRIVPSFMPSDARSITKGKVQAVDTDNLPGKKRKRPLEAVDDIDYVKRASLDLPNSKLTSVYSSPVQTAVTNIENFSPVCGSPKSEFQESPSSPILSGKRPSRNPFARNRNSEDSSELVVKENPALKSPVTTPPSKQSNKFSALSKFARAVQRTSTEGKPIVQSRYFGTNSVHAVEEPLQNKELSPSSFLRDVSNTIEDSTENEPDMMEIYRKSLVEEVKPSIVRKRPLFATISKPTKSEHDETENDHIIQCDSLSGNAIQKSMHDKFGKQDLVPKLKTSPSKNPFQKKIAVVERFGEDHGSHVINESSGPGDQFTNEEDVDDPGFESSTSLTPCSPANVLSQPDDGFESPSKSYLQFKTSPSASSKKSRPPPKLFKPTCRTPGLKKPSLSSNQGQSKLSAFGFIPKPKIQHS